MNRMTQIRLNYIDVLKAVPALEGLRIEPIAGPSDIWGAFPEGTGIGVARRRTAWDLKDHDLNYYIDQPAALFFDVVIKTDCPIGNADGLIGEGQGEDIEASILSARSTPFGVAGETGDIYAMPSEDRVVLHPLRAEGGAGPVAIVLSFRIAPLPI